VRHRDQAVILACPWFVRLLIQDFQQGNRSAGEDDTGPHRGFVTDQCIEWIAVVSQSFGDEPEVVRVQTPVGQCALVSARVGTA
jgi:hypothetical protein